MAFFESEREVLESEREVLDSFVPKSLMDFSAVGVLAPPPTTPLKSNAEPGVFGVFAEPKDANAPDPRPKALDAPAVGEATTAGDMVLKGFLVLWEELSPCLLPIVENRVGWSLEGGPPFELALPVERESLLELQAAQLECARDLPLWLLTSNGGSKDCP